MTWAKRFTCTTLLLSTDITTDGYLSIFRCQNRKDQNVSRPIADQELYAQTACIMRGINCESQ